MSSWLTSLFAHGRRPIRNAKKNAPSIRLVLEALEERAVPTTTTFQQGNANGYSNTLDTYITRSTGTNASVSQAANTVILVDGDGGGNTSAPTFGLLRFDNIF